VVSNPTLSALTPAQRAITMVRHGSRSTVGNQLGEFLRSENASFFAAPGAFNSHQGHGIAIRGLARGKQRPTDRGGRQVLSWVSDYALAS